MNIKNNYLLHFFFLALFSILLYFNTLKIPFTLDDTHMVVANVFIKNPGAWPVFFKGYVSSCPITKGMFRPLLMFTFMFNYALGKLSLAGYHVINIFFHFCNATVLYVFLKAFSKKVSPLFLGITTLLFLSHPIHTETVNYISCRSDLMVTLIIGLGVLSYIRKNYMFSLLCYIGALLSKETGLCLPLLVCAYEGVYNHIDFEYIKKVFRSKKLIYYITLGVFTLLYLWYKKTFFTGISVDPIRTAYANILTQAGVTFFYLKLFFIPYPLALVHDFPILNSLGDPFALFSGIGLVAIIVFIVKLKKNNPLISLGLSWYLLCLLPKFYARLNFIACEHHMYLPSIGLFFVIYALLQKVPCAFRRYALCLTGSTIVLFCTLVWQRNAEWNDPFIFWKEEVKRSPRSFTAHNTLAYEYEKRGKLKKAEEELKKAYLYASRPYERKSARINLARIYAGEKKYEQALGLMKSFFETQPIPAKAYESAGWIYINMGKEKEALDAWEKQITHYPNLAGGYVCLGMYYLEKADDMERAEWYFQKALRINPDIFMPYYGLGFIREREGKIDQAITFYYKALKLNPYHTLSNYALGSIYVMGGDTRGIKYLEKAIKLNPRFAKAYNDLAVAYASYNPPRWELAKKFAERAQTLGYPVAEGFLKYLYENTPPLKK